LCNCNHVLIDWKGEIAHFIHSIQNLFVSGFMLLLLLIILFPVFVLALPCPSLLLFFDTDSSSESGPWPPLARRVLFITLAPEPVGKRGRARRKAKDRIIGEEKRVRKLVENQIMALRCMLRKMPGLCLRSPAVVSRRMSTEIVGGRLPNQLPCEVSLLLLPACRIIRRKKSRALVLLTFTILHTLL
jgi:hypothetical protein